MRFSIKELEAIIQRTNDILSEKQKNSTIRLNKENGFFYLRDGEGRTLHHSKTMRGLVPFLRGIEYSFNIKNKMRPLKAAILQLGVPNINKLYHANEYNETYNWNKKSGETAKQTILSVTKKMKELDWIAISFQTKEGKEIGNEIVWESPDRLVRIKIFTSLESYRISASLILENTDVLETVAKKLKGKVLFPKRVEDLRNKLK